MIPPSARFQPGDAVAARFRDARGLTWVCGEVTHVSAHGDLTVRTTVGTTRRFPRGVLTRVRTVEQGHAADETKRRRYRPAAGRYGGDAEPPAVADGDDGAGGGAGRGDDADEP